MTRSYPLLAVTPVEVIQFPEPMEIPQPRENVYVRATQWRRYRYNPNTRSSELIGGRG